jgi:hypothetical protein
VSALEPPPRELVDRALNEGNHLGEPWCGTVYCPICLTETFSNLEYRRGDLRGRTLADKVEQSEANARVALTAYRATGGQDDDDGAAICDLICDLLHLYVAGGEQRYGEPERVEDLADRAVRDLHYERDPENAEEGA